MAYQSAPSGPSSTASASATSRTLRTSGPAWVKRKSVSGKCPVSGTRPWVGLSPTTPQWCAGSRIEPPRSLPSPSDDMPVATATASPPLEPPELRSWSCGFDVRPKTRFAVSHQSANSGVFVFSSRTAPALFARETTVASRSGTQPAKSREPRVVRMPAVSNVSLTVKGRRAAGRARRRAARPPPPRPPAPPRRVPRSRSRSAPDSGGRCGSGARRAPRPVRSRAAGLAARARSRRSHRAGADRAQRRAWRDRLRVDAQLEHGRSPAGSARSNASAKSSVRSTISPCAPNARASPRSPG